MTLTLWPLMALAGTWMFHKHFSFLVQFLWKEIDHFPRVFVGSYVERLDVSPVCQAFTVTLIFPGRILYISVSNSTTLWCFSCMSTSVVENNIFIWGVKLCFATVYHFSGHFYVFHMNWFFIHLHLTNVEQGSCLSIYLFKMCHSLLAWLNTHTKPERCSHEWLNVTQEFELTITAF